MNSVAAPAHTPRRDGAIGCPQMTQEETALGVAKAKHGRGHPLVPRALAVDAQVSQPAIHAGGMPAIAVACQHQLVPVATAGAAGHAHAELALRGATHELAALLGGCGVPHGLLNRVA